MPAVTGKPARPRRLAGDSGSLDQLIWHLGRAYYGYVGVLERILAEEGLEKHIRPGMGHILFTLFEQDDLSIKEIAARSQLACSTLTGLLERMAKAGLIERRRDEQDGRVTRVRLTELARSLEPRCRTVVRRLNDMLREGLGDASVGEAKRLLQRMTAILREASVAA